MTQVQPERPPAADALSEPFTPGAPANPPELADFPETLAGAAAGAPRRPEDRGLRRGVAQRLATTASPRATSSAARSARSPRSSATSRGRRPPSTPTSSRWSAASSTSPTSPPTTSTAPSAAPASCAARTRCSPATSTGSAPAPSTSSRRCARWPSRAASTSRGWRSWNERTDLRTHEPVLGETPVSQETGPRLGRGPRPPDRRRDGPVRRLRGGVLPDVGAAGGRPDAADWPATSSA